MGSKPNDFLKAEILGTWPHRDMDLEKLDPHGKFNPNDSLQFEEPEDTTNITSEHNTEDKFKPLETEYMNKEPEMLLKESTRLKERSLKSLQKGILSVAKNSRSWDKDVFDDRDTYVREPYHTEVILDEDGIEYLADSLKVSPEVIKQVSHTDSDDDDGDGNYTFDLNQLKTHLYDAITINLSVYTESKRRTAMDPNHEEFHLIADDLAQVAYDMMQDNPNWFPDAEMAIDEVVADDSHDFTVEEVTAAYNELLARMNEGTSTPRPKLPPVSPTPEITSDGYVDSMAVVDKKPTEDLPDYLKYDSSKDNELSHGLDTIKHSHEAPVADEAMQESYHPKSESAQRSFGVFRESIIEMVERKGRTVLSLKEASSKSESVTEYLAQASNPSYNDYVSWVHKEGIGDLMVSNQYFRNIAMKNSDPSGSMRSNSSVHIPPSPPKEFVPEEAPAELTELMALYANASEEDAQVELSVAQKYEEIYAVAYRTAKGRALKRHAFICGTPGIGKDQPHTSKIKTPEGWVTMGDIAIGDIILTPEGTEAPVTNKYPQGVKSVYEFTLMSGRTARAGIDHLWEANIDGEISIVKTRDLIVALAEDKTIKLPVAAEIEYKDAVEKLDVIDDFPPTFPVKQYEPLTKILRVGQEESSCIQIDSEDHLYITDNYIVTHNTYTVAAAVEKGALETGQKYEMYRGSIGKSLSAILAFFWDHKDNMVILLDDCDGFLTGSSDDVINTLKAAMDTDNPVVATGSSDIRKRVAKAVGYDVSAKDPGDSSGANDAYLNESSGKGLFFCTDRLHEGIVELQDLGGNVLAAEKLEESDKVFWNRMLEAIPQADPKDVTSRRYIESTVFGGSLLREESDNLFEEDPDEGGDPLFTDDENPGDDISDEETSLDFPTRFDFLSKIIFVSNMMQSQVPDAIAGRCNIKELYLTKPEIMERLGQILPELLKNETAYTKEELDWAKANVFRWMSAVVAAEAHNAPIMTASGQKVNVSIKIAITFRFFNDMCDKWMQLADAKMMTTTTPDFDEIEKAIALQFISQGLLVAFRGDLRK
jgi:hypothetical protein